MSAPVSGTDSAAAAAAAALARQTNNMNYLASTVDKVSRANPVGSNGTTAAFNAGQTLLWNVPVANNGFLRALRFTCNMTVNYTPGTTIVNNACAPYGLFSEVAVNFNGTMVRVHPYIPAVVLPRVKRYLGPTSNGLIVAGNQDTDVQNMLRSTFPVANGNNQWLFTFEIPLNVLNDLDPSGMLPIMGTSSPVQVSLTCNPAVVGKDPLINCINTDGTIAVTGTIALDCVYRDGTNLWSPAKLPLDLTGLPTVQWIIDNRVTNLQAGTITRGQIKTLLRHYYMFSLVIDGNQSNAFSRSNNIAAMELDPDATGSNPIVRYGSGTNVSMDEWYRDIRRVFGQDMDPGVIPWVTAPAKHQPDASNQIGNMVLNMTPDGWTTVYQGYQLNTLGSVAGITPRVETYLISANPQGLIG